MKVNFKIIERLADIGEKSGKFEKLLTLTSWGESPAKLDLRQWWKDESGELQPAKGLTLSRKEAENLAAAINDYLARENAAANG